MSARSAALARHGEHQTPPLRLLLVWDNLTGHKTPELMLWLCAHGIMPLYTPVGGSWLNMAESIQRVLKDVDSRELALALKAANEEVKNKVFKNMSERAATRTSTGRTGSMRLAMSAATSGAIRVIGPCKPVQVLIFPVRSSSMMFM